MFKKVKKYLIFILPLFFAVVSFNNVSAARTSNADLYKKSLIMGVKTCYQKYAKDSIYYKDFSDYTSIFEDKTSSDDVWITTHVGNSLNSGGRNDSNLNCAQVFAGYKSQAKGLKDYYNIPKTLTKLGYEFSHAEGTDQITFKIDSVKDSSNSNSNEMQFIGKGISCDAEQKYHNGWIFKYYYWEITGCSGKTGISYNGEELFVLDGDINDGFLVTGTGAETFSYNGDHFSPLKYWTSSHTSEQVSLESAFEETNFRSMLKTDAEQAANKYYSLPSATVESAISIPESTDKTNPNSIYKPKNGNKTEAATALIQNLRGSFASIDWTSDDKYSLYYQYLLDIQKSYPDININQCSTEKPNSGNAFKNSPTSWCIINIPTSAQNAKDEILSVFGNSGLIQGTFQNVLEWFNNEDNYKNVSEDTYANAAVDDSGNLVPEESTDTTSTDKKEITCMNSGALNSLGWVVCPILDVMNNATDVLYDNFVEPALYVDVSLLNVEKNSSESAVKSGWSLFRDFANWFFIIFFLIVIFSQLTGVGLDNYNIKKTLPRLIVAAILINLSYVLCEICIDVSNILGRGIMDLFNGIQVSTPESIGGISAGGLATGTLTAVALISIILAGIWSILASGGFAGIVVMVVLAAISIVISLLFLFLVLAAREAAVIVLIILSPVAIASYMLPNTKKMIFDKWKTLFQNLLLVYPVCGFLVGGGDFVSRVLLSAGSSSDTGFGFFSAFAAMLVGIVPIFFIPRLVRQSLSAIGDIGAKISNFGRGVSQRGRAGAEKFANNSEHIKQWRAGSADRFQAFKNRRGLNSRNARVRAGAVKAEGARRAANAEIERLSDPDGIERRLSAIQAAEEDKAYDEAISQRLALMKSGGENGGIRMRDGSRSAYTMDNMVARVKELEQDSRTRQLTANERQEFGALARGLANEKGGASKLHKIVRHAGEVTDNDGNVLRQDLNENFMQAMGDIYSQDATVQSKMREKDAGDSAYIETFMPGGAGATPGGGQTFSDFHGSNEYTTAVNNRVKSYAVGLNQGGEALNEYIGQLGARDCQTIRDNDELYYGMDVADRATFDAHARSLGVNGPSSTNVVIVPHGPTPTP